MSINIKVGDCVMVRVTENRQTTIILPGPENSPQISYDTLEVFNVDRDSGKVKTRKGWFPFHRVRKVFKFQPNSTTLEKTIDNPHYSLFDE